MLLCGRSANSPSTVQIAPSPSRASSTYWPRATSCVLPMALPLSLASSASSFSSELLGGQRVRPVVFFGDAFRLIADAIRCQGGGACGGGHGDQQHHQDQQGGQGLPFHDLVLLAFCDGNSTESHRETGPVLFEVRTSLCRVMGRKRIARATLRAERGDRRNVGMRDASRPSSEHARTIGFSCACAHLSNVRDLAVQGSCMVILSGSTHGRS